jgi:hypothetical protein
MSKAFDRVDHAKLLQHLFDIELCPRLLAWLRRYTTGRRQRVMVTSLAQKIHHRKKKVALDKSVC